MSSGRIHIHPDDLEACAAQCVKRHAEHIEDGFKVKASSSMWHAKNRTITARFVYRNGRDVITCIVRGLRPVWS